MELDIYNQIVNDYKENEDKVRLISIMTDYCSDENTTPEDIYKLKVKLETEFSLDVGCKYMYIGRTPINYGCDLREIFYNRNNELIEGGAELLEIFKQKKMDDMWHIMTDIDDTIYPNTEHSTYIAGSDASWHNKVPYPGIKLFYYRFYQQMQNKYAKYSTILSATPGALKTSKLRNTILKEVLRKYGFIQGPESKIKILSNIGSIVENYNTISNKRVADKLTELFVLLGNTKFERFKQYISIFPEYKILFIGDNGQGDVLAGQRMLELTDTDELRDRCNVFIHKVYDIGNYKTVNEEAQNISRMHFFKNYAEVATRFSALGIFTEDQASDIKRAIETQKKLRNNSRFSNLYGGKRSCRNKGTKSSASRANKNKTRRKN